MSILQATHCQLNNQHIVSTQLPVWKLIRLWRQILAPIRPNLSNMTLTNVLDWSSNEIMDGEKELTL
jgi:hypothetical protein